MNAIEIRSLWVKFQEHVILEDIDLDVSPQEFLGIIGPNGGGKTVLLKTILGLVPAHRGTIRIFGKEPERAGRLAAFVPQHAPFDRSFPIEVFEVVLSGRIGLHRLGRRFSRADREAAMEALKATGIQDLARRQIGKLSGGQLQRVLISRALAVEARLLLLDEPTSNLDVPGSQQLYELLGELSKQRAIVLVGHDVGIMSHHVRTVACLNHRLHYHGGPEPSAEAIERTYGPDMARILHHHPEHESPGRPH